MPGGAAGAGDAATAPVIPVVVVAGFLGAGKTTLVNHILAHAGGRRIAAIVNDFGAINVDAALLGADADGVVGLQNGCVCCTLQGDLLRTIGILLRRDPAPEGIVIETSGIADPAAIVASLLDPVVYREAPLDAVVGLVDADDVGANPGRLEDALYRSQLTAADFVVLNKLDLVVRGALPGLVERLRAAGMRGHVLEAEWGRFPMELLFTAGLHAASFAPPARPALSAGRYDTLVWTAPGPLSMAAFQAAMERLAPLLVRAKGVLAFADRPTPLLFQLVGRRATISPGPVAAGGLVLIHEIGRLDHDAARAALDACVRTPPAGTGVPSAGR